MPALTILMENKNIKLALLPSDNRSKKAAHKGLESPPTVMSVAVYRSSK
mgnify:CR=1 FL=1